MQQGDLIAGKYRIDQILGQGGMGVVVAATNLHLDQRVALKFLLPELLGDAVVVERLLREARASARLRSEHICRVYDVGLENGAPFIVMELLDGRDLASMVSGNGPLPISAAADYILQTTIGLAEAHALGIVHRDLKPANLFVTKRLDGTSLVKILDFGIAKAPNDTQLQLTRTTAVMGSPGYMSPEQLRSTRDADARSDIWALGVILYELVYGRQLFVAESITELALRIAIDPTPPMPGVPPEFERVVARCLEKDPSRRFADVSELAAALAPFGSIRIAEAAVGTANMLSLSGSHPRLRARTSDPAPTTLGSSAGAVSSLGLKRSRVGWWVAGLAVVAVIATVAVVKLEGLDAPAAAQQPRDAEPTRSQPAAAPPAGAAPSKVAPAAPSPVDVTVAPPALPQPSAPASPPPKQAPPTPLPASRPPALPSPPLAKQAPPVNASPAPTQPAVKPAQPPPLGAAPPKTAPPKTAPPKTTSPKTTSPRTAPRDVGESRE